MKRLTSFDLRVIAVISMAIDHVGAVIFPNLLWMRMIGRLAFPLYCFLLVEGFTKTSNRNKYLSRLALFALISELPFDKAFFNVWYYPGYQNVFFTLALGVVALMVMDYFKKDWFYGLPVVVAIALFANWLHTDYSWLGIVLITLLYVAKRYQWSVALPLLIYCGVVYFAGYQLLVLSIVALIPIMLYNGNPGYRGFKLAFYAFYPIHLLLLGLYHYIR